MITIIKLSQGFKHLLSTLAHFLRQHINISRHLCFQFFSGNTTDSCILIIHTYIRNIIQFTKDTQLRELRNTGQEDKTEHWFTILQRTIKIAHNIAKHRQVNLAMNNVKKRCIILINQYDNLLTCLFISSLNERNETVIRINCRRCNTPYLFLLSKSSSQISFQLVFLHVLTSCHTEMQYRIFRPLIFQLFDG